MMFEMSPARSRTSLDAIVVAARDVLEADGLEALAMERVAASVGVRAPSLYKHVANRAALIRAVAQSVVDDLAVILRRATAHDDPATALRETAIAYRAFVRANPNGYGLLFAPLAPEMQPDGATIADLGRPIVAAVAALSGDDGALERARTFVAWAHGAVSMELAGGFRLGGDLDLAYGEGIEMILAGITARATPASG
jgi:AcrR family transcriptional regulator